MLVELDALERNGTWDVVPRPSTKSVVTCKWLFIVKLKSYGNLDRCKALLVVRARTLLVVATVKGWGVTQLDVTNAFLHGHLEEENSVSELKHYVNKGRFNIVCKLKKSLYRLQGTKTMVFTILISGTSCRFHSVQN
ncbi:hypothetical protein V2J09_017084 [Rumex salicifolius]